MKKQWFNRIISESINKVLNEDGYRNSFSDNLEDMLYDMETISQEELDSMDENGLWDILRTISKVNSNAYKGYGLSQEQDDFNKRIYAAKVRIVPMVIKAANETGKLKIGRSGDLILFKNSDGRQITLHSRRTETEPEDDSGYNDNGQKWDGVEMAWKYDNPEHYTAAKDIFTANRAEKNRIMQEYTDKIQNAAYKVLCNSDAIGNLGLEITSSEMSDIIDEMKPFVSNNPNLHTDINVKSIFGNKSKMVDDNTFRPYGEMIARMIGYGSTKEAHDDITMKMREIDNNISNSFKERGFERPA